MRSEVGVGRQGVHHVQEVLDVAKVLLGWNNGLANPVPVTGGGDGWGASDHAVDVLVTLLPGLVDVSSHIGRVGFGIETGHGSHQSAHHGHGVGIVAESLDEGLQAVVIGRVLHDLLGEGIELLRGGQLTIDKQECGLQEIAPLSQLLNGVAPVLKDALLAIDERDARDAVDSVHVGGIVRSGHGAGWALDLREVSGVNGSILDWQLVVLASSVIHNG